MSPPQNWQDGALVGTNKEATPQIKSHLPSPGQIILTLRRASATLCCQIQAIVPKTDTVHEGSG